MNKNEYLREWRKKNPEKVRENNQRNYKRWATKANLKAKRERDTLKKFGLRPEQKREMLTAQDGRCAICLRRFGDECAGPCIDHDHVTGAVRSLLCKACNFGVGFAESPTRVLYDRYLRGFKKC